MAELSSYYCREYSHISAEIWACFLFFLWWNSCGLLLLGSGSWMRRPLPLLQMVLQTRSFLMGSQTFTVPASDVSDSCICNDSSSSPLMDGGKKQSCLAGSLSSVCSLDIHIILENFSRKHVPFLPDPQWLAVLECYTDYSVEYQLGLKFLTGCNM